MSDLPSGQPSLESSLQAASRRPAPLLWPSRLKPRLQQTGCSPFSWQAAHRQMRATGRRHQNEKTYRSRGSRVEKLVNCSAQHGAPKGVRNYSVVSPHATANRGVPLRRRERHERAVTYGSAVRRVVGLRANWGPALTLPNSCQSGYDAHRAAKSQEDGLGGCTAFDLKKLRSLQRGLRPGLGEAVAAAWQKVNRPLVRRDSCVPTSPPGAGFLLSCG